MPLTAEGRARGSGFTPNLPLVRSGGGGTSYPGKCCNPLPCRFPSRGRTSVSLGWGRNSDSYLCAGGWARRALSSLSSLRSYLSAVLPPSLLVELTGTFMRGAEPHTDLKARSMHAVSSYDERCQAIALMTSLPLPAWINYACCLVFLGPNQHAELTAAPTCSQGGWDDSSWGSAR